MREHALPRHCQHSILPLSHASSDVAQTNPGAAESPNGCPRNLSSDTAKNFTTLLKMINLPGFVVLLACRQIIPLTLYLSTDSPNVIKCQISPHSRPSSESQRSTRCPLSDLRYLRSFAMRTLRRLRDSRLPSFLERGASADGLLTRTRSSTSLYNRGSHPHCGWRTTWRLEEGRIR